VKPFRAIAFLQPIYPEMEIRVVSGTNCSHDKLLTRRRGDPRWVEKAALRAS
jgi:hypothetical protein